MPPTWSSDALVSVVMPVHNGMATLPEALDSIQRQSLHTLQIIVVDDGSTDDTRAFVAAQAQIDPRLELVTAGRVGLVAALSLGLERARGELVARMDADDVALPGRLAAQRERFLAQPSLAVLGTRVESFSAEGDVGQGYRLYDQWLNGLLDHEAMARERFVESPLAHPSVMFRRGPIRALGGYRDLGWPEDYDLWLRCFEGGLRVGKLEDVLLRWREHPRRSSRHLPAYRRDAFLRCKAHFLARGPLRQAQEVWLWGAGPIGRRLGHFLREQGVNLTAYLDIDPKKVGGHSRGIPIRHADTAYAPATGATTMVVAAVGARGARDLIRQRAAQLGWCEGTNFLCAA